MEVDSFGRPIWVVNRKTEEQKSTSRHKGQEVRWLSKKVRTRIVVFKLSNDVSGCSLLILNLLCPLAKNPASILPV